MDCALIFNEKLYLQIDGLSMGDLIAPTVANIFMSHLENKFLETCPTDFKPIFIDVA